MHILRWLMKHPLILAWVLNNCSLFNLWTYQRFGEGIGYGWPGIGEKNWHRSEQV